MSEPDVERLMRENDILRARLAKHECIYGHQSKNGVCNLGYPGCACADDIFVGESSLYEMWRQKVEVLKGCLGEFVNQYGRHCEHPACKDMKKYRYLEYNPDIKRMELDGLFTSDDLRKIANWMDSDDHPLVEGLPMIKVDLSPITPLS